MKFTLPVFSALLALAAATPTPLSDPSIDPAKRHLHEFHIVVNGEEVGEMQVEVAKRNTEDVRQHVHLMMDGTEMEMDHAKREAEAEAEAHNIHHYVHFGDMDMDADEK